MNPQTLTAIVIGSFGGLIFILAAIIKGMVSDKLIDLKNAIAGVQESQNSLRDDIHDIDLRLTRLEVEHDLGDK
jgi:hypothetical protein